MLEFDEDSRLRSSFQTAKMYAHLPDLRSFTNTTNDVAITLVYPY